MLLCEHELLEEVSDNLGFVVKKEEVTDRIVNDDEFDLDNILKAFDYQLFDRTYRQIYLEETPVWFAEKRIAEMKDSSRYLDHQVVYNFKNSN